MAHRSIEEVREEAKSLATEELKGLLNGSCEDYVRVADFDEGIEAWYCVIAYAAELDRRIG